MNIDEMITMYEKMNSYFIDIMVEEAASYPILGFLVMNFATLFMYIEGSPSWPWLGPSHTKTPKLFPYYIFFIANQNSQASMMIAGTGLILKQGGLKLFHDVMECRNLLLLPPTTITITGVGASQWTRTQSIRRKITSSC